MKGLGFYPTETVQYPIGDLSSGDSTGFWDKVSSFFSKITPIVETGTKIYQTITTEPSTQPTTTKPTTTMKPTTISLPTGTNYWVWIIGGAAVLFLLLRKR